MIRKGRPPKYDETMVQVSVRLTKEELAIIDAVADQIGESRNEALRRIIAQTRRTVAKKR